jgi:hypothetical protein
MNLGQRGEFAGEDWCSLIYSHVLPYWKGENWGFSEGQGV